MPNAGNSSLSLVYYYAGSIQGVDTSIINPPLGSLILNTATGGIPYIKTVAAGTNTVDQLVTLTGTQTLTNKTLTSPTITGASITGTLTNPTIVDGTTTRFYHTEAFAITGAALHAGVLTAVTFSAAAVAVFLQLDITTIATGACTIDVGYTAVSATTASDTFLDGVDANAAVALFDSNNAALDTGANAHAQKAASGKWITVKEASGDATGMVAKLYVTYYFA